MPTIDIPDKICPHCGGIRWNIQPSNGRIVCVQRLKERAHRHYLKNADHIKKRTRKNEVVYLQDPIIKKQRRANILAWRKNNPDKVRQYKRKVNRKNVQLLSDEYIKRQLVQYTNLKFSDIPPDLVILKRKQLELSRQLRQAS